MITADSVTAKLRGLIARANEASGNNDTDLTAAVGSLIAGFGQGGGGVLTVGNVDLHDRSEDVPNTFIAAGDGAETAYNGYSSTGFIKVTPGKFYAISTTQSFNLHECGHFDSNKKHIKKMGQGAASSAGDNIFLILCAIGDYMRLSMQTKGIANLSIYECEGDIISVDSIVMMAFENGTSEEDYIEALREMGVEV